MTLFSKTEKSINEQALNEVFRTQNTRVGREKMKNSARYASLTSV